MENMSEKDQKAAIESWSIEGPRREAERLRVKKGEHVPDEELEAYHSKLAEVKALLAPPPVPAMPVIAKALPVLAGGDSSKAGGDPFARKQKKASRQNSHQKKFYRNVRTGTRTNLYEESHEDSKSEKGG